MMRIAQNLALFTQQTGRCKHGVLVDGDLFVGGKC